MTPTRIDRGKSDRGGLDRAPSGAHAGLKPHGPITVRALAKINLFLHVGERQANGYHDLKSLVVFADYGDTLRAEHAAALSLSIEGPFSRGLPVSDDNLVLKAARALAQRVGRQAQGRILLTKRLPIASGIGGGSADAAAALRALAQLWEIDVSHDEMLQIADGLGADVPMCIASAPAFVEGRGERISPVCKLPDFALVLANPMVEVSTAEAFKQLKSRTGVDGIRCPQQFEGLEALIGYLRTTNNDLEQPAIEIAPMISDVLSELRRQPNILLARMSGSGATCFGLFAHREHAHVCATQVARAHPEWWVVGAGLAATDFVTPSVIESLT